MINPCILNAHKRSVSCTASDDAIGCRGKVLVRHMWQSCLQAEPEGAKPLAEVGQTRVPQHGWLQLLQVGSQVSTHHNHELRTMSTSFMRLSPCQECSRPIPTVGLHVERAGTQCSSRCELLVRRLASLLGNEEAALSRFSTVRENKVGSRAVEALKSPANVPKHAAGGKKLPIMLSTVKVNWQLVGQ